MIIFVTIISVTLINSHRRQSQYCLDDLHSPVIVMN